MLDVSLRVHYSHAEGQHRSLRNPGHRTVVWLAPLSRSGGDDPAPATYSMLQKDKSFHPGLLVIPVGSTVSFPNADPFFHNVFSLFNGRRFDLGLYQSGQSRTVLFNREGVSYIFCNIHPEMSAVIISLKTPYYASPNGEGLAVLHGVPAGSYRLQVWSEAASAEFLHTLDRAVTVSGESTNLGTIDIPTSSSVLDQHLNKFGQPYDTQAPPQTY
jgi:plastocyanin